MEQDLDTIVTTVTTALPLVATAVGILVAVRALLVQDDRAALAVDVKILHDLDDPGLRVLVEKHVEYHVTRLYSGHPSRRLLWNRLRPWLPIVLCAIVLWWPQDRHPDPGVIYAEGMFSFFFLLAIPVLIFFFLRRLK